MESSPIKQHTGTAILHDGNGPRDDSQRGFADNPRPATDGERDAKYMQVSREWRVFPLGAMSGLDHNVRMVFEEPVSYAIALRRALGRWRLVDVEAGFSDRSISHERAKPEQL